MTMIEAIRDAHDVMMGRDDNVVVFGEDVGYFGGVFRCTDGLQSKHGRNRVFDMITGAGGPSPGLQWSAVPGPRAEDTPTDVPLCP